METVNLSIDGTHCEGCAHIIQSVLARLEGVQTSVVSHRDGSARVLFDPARATRDEITRAIEKAGYRAQPQV